MHIWTHLDTLYPIGLTSTHLIGVDSLEIMWTHYDKTYLNTHKDAFYLIGLTSTHLISVDSLELIWTHYAKKQKRFTALLKIQQIANAWSVAPAS